MGAAHTPSLHQPPLCAGRSLRQLQRWRRAACAFLLIANLLPALYTGLVHQRGTLDVMGYLQGLCSTAPGPAPAAILVLMPCHSTPHYRSVLGAPPSPPREEGACARTTTVGPRGVAGSSGTQPGRSCSWHTEGQLAVKNKLHGGEQLCCSPGAAGGVSFPSLSAIFQKAPFPPQPPPLPAPPEVSGVPSRPDREGQLRG